MSKSRKLRCDGTAGTVKAMQNAIAGDIPPPKNARLRDCDMPFWRMITAARARDKWDEFDLVMAAQLARTMTDIEALHEELEREGHTITNARGTPMANPKHNVLETLMRREVLLSRTLHVNPTAKEGRPAHQGKALAKQREAQQHLDDADDDLIPRAPAH